MRVLAAGALLVALSRLAMPQTPLQITGVCPGNLSASVSYPATVNVTLTGVGFTPTTQIQSHHPAFLNVPASYRFVSPTQMSVTLVGSGLGTPGVIDLTAVDVRASLSITTTALRSGVIGVPYNATVSATGGTAPLAWSATGLPPGLAINPNTGTITGTPLTPGTSFAAITVRDADNPPQAATGFFAIVINSSLMITTASPLPAGIQGVPYTATVTATGGTTPYTWSDLAFFKSGRLSTLPQGLTINPASGVISGTPTTAGVTTATITVQDSTVPQQTASADLSITINPALTVTTARLPAGAVDFTYTPVQATATGGVLPYSWVATNLPAGLTMSPSGLITGVPTTPGTNIPVALTVTDSGTPRQTATANYLMNIDSLYVSVRDASSTLSIAAPRPFSPTSPRAASAQAASASAVLNPRLTVTSNVVNLNILPTPALNSLSPTETTETAPLTLNIAGGPFIPSAPACAASSQLIWNGTAVTTTLSVTSNLVNAVIPASLVTPGRVTVAVENPVGVRTAALPLTINPRPAITTTSLPDGIGGKPYPAVALTHTGGTLPLTWSLTASAAGLTIDTNGIISGTLPATGPLQVQVTVRDAVAVTGTASFTLNVLPPPVPVINIVPTPIIQLDQQDVVTVALSQAPPATVTGTLNPQFALDPSVAANRNTVDPVFRLSATQFTITPPQTSTQVALQTGLTAGTLTVTVSNVRMNGVDVTPAVPPTLTTRIAPAPPVIQSACLVPQASGGVGLGAFTVQVNGFSNTREITRARFLFTGGRLGANELDLNNASTLFGPYYNTNFVAFSYLQVLQVSGDVNDIGNLSVILENTQGASAAFPAAQKCP